MIKFRFIDGVKDIEIGQKVFEGKNECTISKIGRRYIHIRNRYNKTSMYKIKDGWLKTEYSSHRLYSSLEAYNSEIEMINLKSEIRNSFKSHEFSIEDMKEIKAICDKY